MRYNVRDERGRFVKKAAKKCTKKKCCSKKPPVDPYVDKFKCAGGAEGPTTKLTVEQQKIIKQVLDILDDYLKELDNKEQLLDAFRKYMWSTKVPVDVPLQDKVSWQVEKNPIKELFSTFGLPYPYSGGYCEVKFK